MAARTGCHGYSGLQYCLVVLLPTSVCIRSCLGFLGFEEHAAGQGEQT